MEKIKQLPEGFREKSAGSFPVQRLPVIEPNQTVESSQEGGVNLLAQLGDCAADDLSHYDVTSELVRESSMAAKR